MEQLLQPLAIKPNDDLAVDDDDGSGQVAKFGQLLERLRIVDYIPLDE